MATSVLLRSRIGAFMSLGTLVAATTGCFIEDAFSGVGLCRDIGPVATVKVEPSQVALRAGDSTQVSLSQLDARGRDAFLCGATDVVWTSAQSSVAMAHGDRLSAWIIARAAGETTLNAAAAGRSSTVRVVVTPR